MPRQRKSKKPQNKKKQPYKRKNNYRRKNTSSMVISRPLLPQTQKVGMRYTTRIRINPAEIKSGNTETANNMSLYTFAWNNLHDIDQTSIQAIHHTMDGARNHQPIMYDQYKEFYNKNTVIGARAKLTFMSQERILKQPIYGPISHANPQHVAQGHGDVTGYQEKVADPVPCYVGILNSQYADDQTPTVKFDDVLEKKECYCKMLLSQNKPQVIKTSWSIRKEPSRRYDLELENGLYPASGWGALFESDIIHTQMRHLHLFAHPCSTNEQYDFNKDPLDVDVSVEFDYIVILSDRKEIGQSA
jgi:hypothetical protein